MQPTLGLAMIMKDEVADLDRILTNYGQYFDAIYVTVTHRPTYHALLKIYGGAKDGTLSLSYFEWCDHYGKARLYNQQHIKTDYWMWIDLDDEIIGAEKIPGVVEQMSKNQLDIALFPYDYYQNAFGDSESMLWRERIIKTHSEIRWEDRARHETVITPSWAKRKQLNSVMIKHSKPIEQKIAEIIKVRPLLEKEWQKEQDPQTAMYLGTSYLAEEAFGNALQMFGYAAEYGRKELQVRAWADIANVYLLVKSYDNALLATDRAIAIDPDFPDPWYEKTLIYLSLNAYDRAAKNADIALSKRPDDRSVMAQDPTKYTYKGLFLAAKAHLYNAEVDKAYRLFKKAQKLSPAYIEQQSKSSANWVKTFEEVHQHPEIINEMLPSAPRKWPRHSIVYYTGQGSEFWGPDTIESGMGGSEEAVIYLTRELSKLGWDVTVFCQREETYLDKFDTDNSISVLYRPWFEMNPQDEFDVFIASRRPLSLYSLKARVKLLDLHDAASESSLLSVKDMVTKFMVKSNWHRSLYPNITDDKFAVISNGILGEQFL